VGIDTPALPKHLMDQMWHRARTKKTGSGRSVAGIHSVMVAIGGSWYGSPSIPVDRATSSTGAKMRLPNAAVGHD